jgi:hypothetical protein
MRNMYLFRYELNLNTAKSAKYTSLNIGVIQTVNEQDD